MALRPRTSPRRLGSAGTSAGLRTYGRAADACRDLLTSLPGSHEEPVLLTRSFPITAAGQSRISTGFPLATPEKQANRRSGATLETRPGDVKSGVPAWSSMRWVSSSKDEGEDEPGLPTVNTYDSQGCRSVSC